MGETRTINVLLIEDNADFAKLISLFLDKFESAQFIVTWRQNATEGIDELVQNPIYDAILMDYFLPGMNGLEATRTLKEKNISTAVIFLTVNKDMNIAVEVMKLGVQDYLVKEEISTSILPKTIMSVVEKRRLREEVEELEIRQKRLEAMQELVLNIANDVGTPLSDMGVRIQELYKSNADPKVARYLTIIMENVERINTKMEKLKNLKEDKTVQYIKDIKMIDLS